jgi:flagellar biosynthesis/type III secretory pathway protein FliH
MGTSNYERWRWESAWADEPGSKYKPRAIKYCGDDLSEAYQDGYRIGLDEGKHYADHRINTLKALIGANVRVIKEELKKELSEEQKTLS